MIILPWACLREWAFYPGHVQGDDPSHLGLAYRKNSAFMSSTTFDRGDHFRFGLVFIKKSNQTDFFFFETKNRNRVKPTGFGSVRFGFFREKTCSNRFGSVFPVLAQFSRFWLGFFGLARFFFWFFVGFGSVFFSFLLIKPKPNRPVFSKM